MNMARGGLVCTEDLIDALQNGTLSGAGLDVFEEQPLSPDSPLWHMPTVYITPHCTPQVPDRQAAPSPSSGKMPDALKPANP